MESIYLLLNKGENAPFVRVDLLLLFRIIFKLYCKIYFKILAKRIPSLIEIIEQFSLMVFIKLLGTYVLG